MLVVGIFCTRYVLSQQTDYQIILYIKLIKLTADHNCEFLCQKYLPHHTKILGVDHSAGMKAIKLCISCCNVVLVFFCSWLVVNLIWR